MELGTLEDVRRDMEHGKLNLSGKEINGIKFISYFGTNEKHRSLWNCICHCGTPFVGVGTEIKRGKTKSCGCEKTKINGLYKSRLYRIHHCMMCRCYVPSSTHYHLYGGRGITVCEGWRDFMNFYRWSMENGYREDLTIDRIDVNGNYEPLNCRWATRKEQSNNLSSNNRITFSGETLTMSQWAEKLNINRNTLEKRLNSGWPVEKAFTKPVNAKYSTRGKKNGNN